MSNDKYVGADVHAATTTFAVLDSRGHQVMEGIVATRNKELVAFVKAIRGTVHLTFEEGTQAAWLYEVLRPHVAELVVCNPRVNRLLADGNKSDPIDAAKLAELLRGGQLRGVYHGEHGLGSLKALSYSYEGLVRVSVRSKNQLKAIFRSRGIQTPGEGFYKTPDREEWLSKLPHRGSRHRARLLWEQLDATEPLRASAKQELLAEAKKHEAWKLLKTMPGLGDVRAAQIVAHVQTPHRFRTKRQFWSYSGFAVVTRSTDDYRIRQGKLERRKKVSTRGLNRNHNSAMKAVFKAAAKDASRGELQELYQSRVDAGMRPEMAVLTMARKLSAVALAIWKKGESYDQEKAVTAT